LILIEALNMAETQYSYTLQVTGDVLC